MSNWQFDSWPFFWPQLVFKVSKCVMQTHFRHLSLKRFSMIYGTLQSNGFWPLQSLFEDSQVHWDSNSQSATPFGSVGIHSFTCSHTPKSMKCDSQASLLAHTFVNLCLCSEPKARVATKDVVVYYQYISFLYSFVLLEFVNMLMQLLLVIQVWT